MSVIKLEIPVGDMPEDQVARLVAAIHDLCNEWDVDSITETTFAESSDGE